VLRFRIDLSDYDLISVVLHKGTQNYGHYISLTLDDDSNKWSVCDDSNIQKINEDRISQYLRDWVATLMIYKVTNISKKKETETTSFSSSSSKKRQERLEEIKPEGESERPDAEVQTEEGGEGNHEKEKVVVEEEGQQEHEDDLMQDHQERLKSKPDIERENEEGEGNHEEEKVVEEKVVEEKKNSYYKKNSINTSQTNNYTPNRANNSTNNSINTSKTNTKTPKRKY